MFHSTVDFLAMNCMNSYLFERIQKMAFDAACQVWIVLRVVITWQMQVRPNEFASDSYTACPSRFATEGIRGMVPLVEGLRPPVDGGRLS